MARRLWLLRSARRHVRFDAYLHAMPRYCLPMMLPLRYVARYAADIAAMRHARRGGYGAVCDATLEDAARLPCRALPPPLPPPPDAMPLYMLLLHAARGYAFHFDTGCLPCC